MKKQRPPERKTGIWIDHEKARIVQLNGAADPVLITLASGMETRVRYNGEVKAYARFGQSFLGDQEKKQRRQHQQLTRFYKKIIQAVHDDDYFYVFGPGTAREGLVNAMERDHALHGVLVANEPADHMTDTAIRHKTEDYFSGRAFTAWKRQRRKELREA